LDSCREKPGVTAAAVGFQEKILLVPHLGVGPGTKGFGTSQTHEKTQKTWVVGDELNEGQKLHKRGSVIIHSDQNVIIIM
jgi:hypothetical protein